MSDLSLNSYVLNIKNVSIERGGTVLFSGLNLSIRPGDTVWIRGSNGIGKTSLLKCCAGLLRTSIGEILWNGVDITKQPHGYSAYLGHHDAHKLDLSPVETLEFWNALYDQPRDIKTCLERVGLWERKNQRVRSLSAGQSRRLSLARLYMSNARLWILDEPAAAMDDSGRALIQSLLTEHIAAQGSVLLASHGAPNRVGMHTRLITLHNNMDDIHEGV